MFAPLSPLLGAIDCSTLDRIRSNVAATPRERLLLNFRAAFTLRERRKAFFLSEALTAHGIPPCFRRDERYRLGELDESQRFDLSAYDLQWLAMRYPDHAEQVRGGYASLLQADDWRWLASAEYYWSSSHQGATWKTVKQLALTVDQQWECNVLRSQPIKLAAQGLDRRRVNVRKAIMDELPKAMQRRHEGDARMTLERRYRVWVCSEMAGKSPTMAARLYGLWTGNKISRSVADRDVEWVRRHIPESRKRRGTNDARNDMQ
ncbi:hypothetical protein B0G62_103465 [Paraburkholderia eburnea]|uniref:Uncharacterized protein n=1 Tax=Paraburkholderia eburnea TaxID=1189126 RepID=A0A2S4MGJ3_9BURK|nr:hypothetical protein [Paraburkholderia eburnea]POR53883.1 hypothetical protein B0G62_103465 [Paraburkholderia eburnea]PRZ25851.1 hypothetical protein BX588_102465 [Paraburkholderia eburnea]